MHTQRIEAWQHEHVFLGARHDRNERRTWLVVGLTAAMMVAEIVGGLIFGSMALVADGWHMATHAGALAIAALAYRFARRHARDPRFTFGTGKLGELAGFASAMILWVIALVILYESATRLFDPVTIVFEQALAIAAVGLVVNLLCAAILWEGHGHAHGHGSEHGHSHDYVHAHDHAHEHGRGHDPAHDHRHDDGHAHDRVSGHTHEQDRAHGHAHTHERHHGHDGGHAHDRGNNNGPAAASRSDLNLRGAYLHVLADALTSVLAIAALLAGWFQGWNWMDPIMGIVGALVILRWSVGLLRASGAVLLDTVPDRRLASQISARLETGGDRLADLHLWRLGPGHVGLVASIVSDHPQPPDRYKAMLADIAGLSHVTIEVQPCRAVPAAA
jgi:cation diffusion facilitator family transporter